MILETICAVAWLAKVLPACAPSPAAAVGYVEGEYVNVAPIEVARIAGEYVRRGDKLKAGDRIATLETLDAEIAVRNADAALAEAEAQLGAVQVTVILAAAKFLFHVPFVGDLSMLLAGVLVFVLAMVLLGYVFSTLTRSQMQAMQLAFFFLLPSILMSGFMFPFHGMPVWAQGLGNLLPMTHFLRVVRAIMLKGANWSEIGLEFALLTAFIPAFSLLALLRFRRTLD